MFYVLALKICTHFLHQGAPALIMTKLVFCYFLTTLYIPFVLCQKYIKQPERNQKTKITIFVPVSKFMNKNKYFHPLYRVFQKELYNFESL